MSEKSYSCMTEERFEDVFEFYFHDVTAFLYTYASSRDELHDLVQEVFVKLWEKRDRINIEHPAFKSYLLKIARNHALKKLQRAKRYNVWLEENLIQLTSYQSVDETNNSHAFRGFENAYMKALSKLPNRVLETWKLSREDGLSYTEIAKVMNVSIKTVETNMRNALRLLRDELSEYSK